MRAWKNAHSKRLKKWIKVLASWEELQISILTYSTWMHSLSKTSSLLKACAIHAALATACLLTCLFHLLIAQTTMSLIWLSRFTINVSMICDKNPIQPASISSSQRMRKTTSHLRGWSSTTQSISKKTWTNLNQSNLWVPGPTEIFTFPTKPDAKPRSSCFETKLLKPKLKSSLKT